MTYPGNPSISAEVQKRIRSTFEQTLDLAARGSRQEANLGCDFVLQLDPEFRPAKTLQERLRTSEGEVEVDDLRALLAGRPSEREQKAEADALFEKTDHGLELGTKEGAGEADDTLFDPLEDMDLGDDLGVGGEPGSDGEMSLDEEMDLDGELPDLAGPRGAGTDEVGADDAGEAGDADSEEAGDAAGLKASWQRLLDERRFGEILDQAEGASLLVEGSPELADIATTAGERQEAASFVERFLERARQAAREGDAGEADDLIGKARSLDPTHPDIAATEAAVAGGTPPPPTPEPSRPPQMEGTEPPDLPEVDFTDADLSEPDLPDEPAGFDAAGASGSGDEEGDRRIGDLLDEGQAAFDREDYQGAIDAWSRIFLIDIDHDEASRRIEEARRLKSEQERKVEEIFHDAIRALEDGDATKAEEDLRRVLEIFPSHAAAREQLDRLEAGEVAPPPPPPDADEPVAAQGSEPDEVELKEEILVPPEPGEEHATSTGRQESDLSSVGSRTMVAKTGPASRRFLILGAAVLGLVLIAGFLLYQNRDSFFPNSAEAPAGDGARVDPIARATRLHEAGKTAMAVNQLRRVPPASSQYEEAQALISQWEAAERPADPDQAGEGSGDDARAPTPPDTNQRDLLGAASAAAEAGEYLRAQELIDQAAGVAPLPAEVALLRSRVEAEIEPLQRYIELMNMGEYTRVLPELWRLHNDEPENRDVRQLIADSYYSLALRSLQQGDAVAAVEHLEEAQGVLPEDDAMRRHLQFARTYADRQKDLLYRIYVKYMPPR